MMGLFRREKGRYEGIPDEKLNWNQQQQKKNGRVTLPSRSRPAGHMAETQENLLMAVYIAVLVFTILMIFSS